MIPDDNLNILMSVDWYVKATTLQQWRHNERDGVSNHQPHDCLLKRLFMRRSKKTSKLRVTDICEGNSPVTGDDVIMYNLVFTSHYSSISHPSPIDVYQVYGVMWVRM